jgi:dihydrodipicolinate synthase/N-acetylneuraminate lyase
MIHRHLPPIALPAPIFRLADGNLDLATNARYVDYVAETWIEHVVVAGPMAAGEFCTANQRAAVVICGHSTTRRNT